MSSTKNKLRLAGAFAALAMLALAVSCRGFFQNPTLTSVAISPTAPAVEQGQTLPLVAFGTYDDGSRSQIKSGVSWSSDTPAIASIDPNTGILTGVTPGTAGISASAQALSSTATATVFIVINSISISPTNANIAVDGETASFAVEANGDVNITSGALLNAFQNGVAVTSISCIYDGVSMQVCTDNAAPAGTYQIVASYTGSTLTGDCDAHDTSPVVMNASSGRKLDVGAPFLAPFARSGDFEFSLADLFKIYNQFFGQRRRP